MQQAMCYATPITGIELSGSCPKTTRKFGHKKRATPEGMADGVM